MADETKKPDADKPEAPKAAAQKPEAPKAAQPEAPKAVTLKPGPKQKCIITLGGGIFLRPDAPTTVTAEKYAKLTEDAGFKRLLAAGTVLVVK